MDRIVRVLPGPAGATESTLPLTAWDGVMAENPGLPRAAGRRGVAARAPVLRRGYECYLVPIDSCYELVGAAASGVARLRRRSEATAVDRRVFRRGSRALPGRAGSHQPHR